MLQINNSACIEKIFTQKDVGDYAKISGDFNPIHLDKEYAARTRFRYPIVHGMLVSGLISRLLGNQLPGEGTIYLKQTLSFKKPVYIGDRIKAEVTIVNIDKSTVQLSTICTNQDNKIVIDGEAIVLYKAEEVQDEL